MTTLTATYEPATASVLLTIAPTSSVSAILRTDANGTAVPVRTLDGLLPEAAPFVVRDYEAGHGLASYRVVDAGAGATASVDVAIAAPRLAAVVLPQTIATPTLVTRYDAGRRTSTTVHEVIGRSDPVANLGPLGSRSGSLEVLCRTYELARQVEAVYDAAQVVMLRQPDYPGLDMYHVIDDGQSISSAPTMVGAWWTVTVPYREVRRPADPLKGTLGWTWDDVQATYATWDQLAQVYPTWNDVEVGPVA